MAASPRKGRCVWSCRRPAGGKQQSTGLLHLDIQVLAPKAEKVQHQKVLDFFWQGHKDLNPEPTVLETAALPIELYPYILKGEGLYVLVGLQGFEPGTIRL